MGTLQVLLSKCSGLVKCLPSSRFTYIFFICCLLKGAFQFTRFAQGPSDNDPWTFNSICFRSSPGKTHDRVDQRPFFDSGHVGAGDPQFLGGFPLCFFLAAVQAEDVCASAAAHSVSPNAGRVEEVVPDGSGDEVAVEQRAGCGAGNGDQCGDLFAGGLRVCAHPVSG